MIDVIGLRIRKNRRTMAQSPLRTIRQLSSITARDKINEIPEGIRGIYILYEETISEKRKYYDVRYIGMATNGMQGRLRSHNKKKDSWSHFSIVEVWENIGDEEISELEGLCRYIYRKDSTANKFNVQRMYKKLEKVMRKSFADWVKSSLPKSERVSSRRGQI